MTNESMYNTSEERMMMHHAIQRELGEDNSPETYVELCRKYGIEVPIMPPAYGWEP